MDFNLNLDLLTKSEVEDQLKKIDDLLTLKDPICKQLELDLMKNKLEIKQLKNNQSKLKQRLKEITKKNK